MKFDGGKSSVSTCSGTLLSFILFFIFIGYTAEKLQAFVLKTNANIFIAISQEHFEDTEIFDSSQNLSIAASLISFDSEVDIHLDPTYGELIFTTAEWSLQNDGEIALNYTEV